MIHKNITQFNVLQLYGKTKQEPAIIIDMPRQLLKEVTLFKKRNTLNKFSKILKTKEVNEDVCPHCLKAFMLSKSKEMDMPDEVMDFVYTIGEGNLGHNGYYEDNGKLVKIDESLTEIYD